MGLGSIRRLTVKNFLPHWKVFLPVSCQFLAAESMAATITQIFRCTAALFLFLLITLPQGGQSFSYTQFKTLHSLSHSLAARVANLRRARGDEDGYRRAAAIASRLERGLGWGDALSMGWDYARNYAWRELEYAELYGAVSDMNELLSLFGDFTRGGSSEVEWAAWVGRNYGKVLRVSKSVLGRLLRVFSKSGALRSAIETMQKEVVEGGLLRDCLELGSNDLKGFIQILKDLALQFNSTPDRGRSAEL